MFYIKTKYKKLKAENLQLKIENNRLRRENNEDNIRMREYYEKTYEKRLEFEKMKYNTKIKRKKEVEQICKNLEKRINNNIVSFMDIDTTDDINNLLKLLQYLKEE